MREGIYSEKVEYIGQDFVVNPKPDTPVILHVHIGREFDQTVQYSCYGLAIEATIYQFPSNVNLTQVRQLGSHEDSQTFLCKVTPKIV
jgi:hypothetical protein